MRKFDQFNPFNLTLEQVMDYLYPRVFSTFINANPALAQRAYFYKRFFSTLNLTDLFNLTKNKVMKVFEIGSGTGKGSFNNARILEESVEYGIRYVAVDKRKSFVEMTKTHLFPALMNPSSSIDVYVRDGLHNISQNELTSFGFKEGRIHVYFAEHSAYSELYDLNKTMIYLKGIKKLFKECGLVFLVVQTENSQAQKLVVRNVGASSNYNRHISNLESAIKILNFTVLTKHLNSANLTFPKLSHTDWSSIKNRNSDLNCFGSIEIEKTLHLITFLTQPPSFSSDHQLRVFINELRKHLGKHNSTISIDEYIYSLSLSNCHSLNMGAFNRTGEVPLRKPIIPEKLNACDISSSEISGNIMKSAWNGIAHGILRGTANAVSGALEKEGFSKLKAKFAGEVIYYGCFFKAIVSSKSQRMVNTESCLNIIFESALETGQIFIINTALTCFSQLLTYGSWSAAKANWKKTSNLLTISGICLPFTIFSKHVDTNEILSNTVSVITGAISQTAVESLAKRNLH